MPAIRSNLPTPLSGDWHWIAWADRFAVSLRGAHDLATHDTTQTLHTHESLYRTAGYLNTFTAQLPPYFAGTIYA